jgi:hypothetical protein
MNHHTGHRTQDRTVCSESFVNEIYVSVGFYWIFFCFKFELFINIALTKQHWKLLSVCCHIYADAMELKPITTDKLQGALMRDEGGGGGENCRLRSFVTRTVCQ